MNLGKSMITFAGTRTKIWSEISKHIKILQKHQFEKECKKNFYSIHTTNFFLMCLCIFLLFITVCLFFNAIIAALVLLCLYFIFIYTTGQNFKSIP